MIVLAALGMACATQAATVKWQTAALKTPADANITASNIGFFFYAEDLSDPWGSKATSSGEGDAVTYTVAASSGLGSVSYKSGKATITAGSSYSKGDDAYAAVILTYDSNNDGKIGVGDYYMVGTGSYTLEADVNVTKSVATGAWTQITATTPTPPTPPGPGPIPEPTSGLLLLVGGAMLALRRKQK